jgi:hypothetical protein
MRTWRSSGSECCGCVACGSTRRCARGFGTYNLFSIKEKEVKKGKEKERKRKRRGGGGRGKTVCPVNSNRGGWEAIM